MATGRLPDPNTAPLTAKGDLYTYSTVPARLAVGSNGDTLVADSSTTTGLRWQADWNTGKNKIINGDFYINQRGFSSTTSGFIFMSDRWQSRAGGDGTTTHSVQTFTPGAAPVSGYEGARYQRIVTTGQSNTSVFSAIAQYIEDVRTLAGQTATISFWARANSGTPDVGIYLFQEFGTGGSPSSVVSITGSKTAISTSWARYSFTVNIPSISGKTIGTTTPGYLGFFIGVSTGTTQSANFGNLGIQTNTFDIWGVQVEAGSVATPFTTATGTLAGELAACQRYYYRVTANGAYGNMVASALANSTTRVLAQSVNPVALRVRATSVGISNLLINDGVGTQTVTAVTLETDTSNTAITGVIFDCASGLTQYRPYRIIANNSTTAYLEVSAEL